MIIKDQLNRNIELTHTPQRIVSCVPSITELLFQFVSPEQVVGRTKFCIHPKIKITSIPKLGGTKNLNLNAIKELTPDLIIANKEENDKEQIEQLEHYIPTFVSDISDIEDTCDLIKHLGIIFSKEEKAIQMIKEIENAIIEGPDLKDISALYLIWKDPYMSVGSDTYIDDMLRLAQFKNVLSHKTRYPELTTDDINSIKPEVLLLSSEPFPFAQKHIDELRKSLNYSPTICLVDGEMFSWYGTKTLAGLKYAKKLRISLQKTHHP